MRSDALAKIRELKVISKTSTANTRAGLTTSKRSRKN